MHQMVDQVQQQKMEGGAHAYPERPGEPDCVYYVRHGLCGYGARCRFNHPPTSRNLHVDQMCGKGQFPERIEQPDCQYYLRTGACKFGPTCKYHHPRKRAESPKEEVLLNLSGLPMRLGERECVYYTHTGACKFGLNCKLHHPQTGANGSTVVSMPSSPLYALGTYPSLNPMPFPGIRPAYIMARGSYVAGLQIPVPSSYTPVILSPQLAFKGPLSPVTPLDGIEQSPKANSNTVQEINSVGMYSKPSLFHEDELPDREGQPECQYYLKTGDCGFGASCKFHHPKDRTPIASPSRCTLNVVGLPLRPGEPQCNFYMRHGLCKFGPVCKFDHPILVPFYNTMGTSPVPDMLKSGSPATTANSCAESSAEPGMELSTEEDMQGLAVCMANRTGSSHEGIEDSKG
eukprot:c16856_g1_i1 orf=327-1532(+)